MTEEISTQPLALEIRVKLEASPCRIYGGQICTERACFWVLVLASSVLFHKSPHSQLTIYHQQVLEIDKCLQT